MIRLQQPFSILLDVTQDVSGQHLLAIHFHIIENNSARVYLFRLLEIGTDETATSL